MGEKKNLIDEELQRTPEERSHKELRSLREDVSYLKREIRILSDIVEGRRPTREGGGVVQQSMRRG